MIPLVRGIVHALLWDAMAVRRWLRGLAITFALGGVAYANEVAAVIGSPGAAKTIKVVALTLAFIGGAISVGEPNPKREGTLVPLDPPRGFAEFVQLAILLLVGVGVYMYALMVRGTP